jgi:hypothetical protein
MQVVVVALFDPILGQLDKREFEELTGDVQSEIGTPGHSPSLARSDSSWSSEGSELARRVLYGKSIESSQGSETSFVPSDMLDMSPSSSVEPAMGFGTGEGSPIRLGIDSDNDSGDIGEGGSTRRRTNKNKNKKTRKYIGNRKNKTKSKRKMNTIRRIINGNMRARAHTRKNTHVSRTKPKTMKIKNKKFPKRIYLYSTPRIAQRMAYKYLGRIKTAKLYPARNPAKKYMVYDPKNNKWVNFGQMGYEDYTKHHDKTRRKNYLTRTKGMLGDWKSNKYSANNLSRNILW